MAKISPETRQEVASALAGLAGPAARHAARDIAARTGLSLSYIYKISSTLRPPRKPRSDRQKRRIALSAEIEDFMLGLTKRADLSAESILWITSRHFGLSPDFLSTASYNRWLRENRVSRKNLKADLRPYRSFEAASANDLHHYDTTVAEAYYANNDGSIGYEGPDKRYKNKPGNRKPRLVLYSLVDDFSRVLFARFYFSENTLNLLDFLAQAWGQKQDRRFPFYGIPSGFYADKGSPQQSHKFLNAMRKLGVSMIDSVPAHSKPHGSRMHGKVERTFGEGLLGEFMKLTQVYNFRDLEELNATLHEWLIRLNNKKHRVTKEARFARWLRSVGTPRHAPTDELMRLLHYERAERLVSGNLQISLDGKTYQLPYDRPYINWVSCRVEVYWYPGQTDQVSVVYDHQEVELRANAPVIDLAGNYRSIAKTDQEARLESLSQEYQSVNIPQVFASDLPYLPKQGQAFDSKQIATKTIETPQGIRPSFVSERKLNKVQVRKELQALGVFAEGQISPEELILLTGIMAGREEVSESEMMEKVHAWLPGRTGTDDG